MNYVTRNGERIYLTTTEMADACGVTRQAIDLAIKRGEIPYIKAGRYRLIWAYYADQWRANETAQARGRCPKTR